MSMLLFAAAAFLSLWSPMVPGPVTTLEALLGHITEHLLQLLGMAEHQRGRKEGVREEEVQGFLRGLRK